MALHTERFELAREQFGKALARLHEALEADESAMVRDALIQRFEFTYELGWKSMFYWLRVQGESVPEMAKPVIQAAFRCGLISGADVWEQIKDNRNETSHTYNELMAVKVVSFVRAHAVAAFDALQVKLQAL